MQQKFIDRSPGADEPQRNIIRNLIMKFRETGSVTDAAKSVRSPVSEKTINEVEEAIRMHPMKFVRRLSQEVEVPKRTAHDILRKSLHFYPRKMTVMHKLKESDYNYQAHIARTLFYRTVWTFWT